MPSSPIRTAAAIVAAFAVAATSGCSGDEPKKPAKRPRSSAVATCAGAECKVRVKCKGRVEVRLGPAPVQVRTRKTVLVTTFYADFAGSKSDTTIRC